MVLLDVNVLIYAVNESAPQHERVRLWIETARHADDLLALCWDTLSGFVRIATNPRSGMQVLSRDEALDFVDAWLGLPDARVIGPVAGHYEIFRSLLDESQAVGNLVTDAHLAAIAIGNGAKLASCDIDFARFSKLRWINPLGT